MFLAKHTVRVPGLVTRRPDASGDPEGTPASRSGAEDTGPAKWAGVLSCMMLPRMKAGGG